MEDALAKLEKEEIGHYKEELKKYLEEIADQDFYPYFGMVPVTKESYDRICRDLMTRGYYCLLTRFSERCQNVLKGR